MVNILINNTDIIENVNSIEFIEDSKPQIKAYSQRNIFWRDDKMVTKTIGGVGCAMTACAMLCSQFDDSHTPKTLNKFLRNNGGYTQDNRIYWHKVSDYCPQLKFDSYYLWRNIPANMPFFYEFLKDQPVIIQVDFHPGGVLNTHFVLALSKHGENDIDIIDPWDGAHTQLMNRYALVNWNLERAIYAMVVYKWKS